MSRPLVFAVLLLASCKSKEETRAAQCQQLVSMSLAVADSLGKALAPDAPSAAADPEIKAKMAVLQQQCLTWPEDVFACMRANDETSPKCIEAMSKVSGLVPDGTSTAPAGPAVVAHAELGEMTIDGIARSLGADGTLIAAPEGAVIAVAATGKEMWRVAMKHDHWLFVAEGNVLVGDREAHEIVLLDAATGAVKWRAPVPASAEYGERTTEGAVGVDGRILVAIADGRFLRVDAVACAKPKQRGCVTPAFVLEHETIDNPQLLAVGSDLLIAESDAIRRISTTGAVRTKIHVRDNLGGMAVAGDRVAAVIDDELVLFDFAHCTAQGAIELPRKQGRMYMRGDGECEGECIPAPAECVIARTELSDVDSLAPSVLHDGAVAVSNMDGVALVAKTGETRWAAEIDSIGPVREHGSTVMFVNRGDDDKPARLVALDVATGKVVWVTSLTGVPGNINSTTDPVLEVSGPWVVAGVKSSVVWIKLP